MACHSTLLIPVYPMSFDVCAQERSEQETSPTQYFAAHVAIILQTAIQSSYRCICLAACFNGHCMLAVRITVQQFILLEAEACKL